MSWGCVSNNEMNGNDYYYHYYYYNNNKQRVYSNDIMLLHYMRLRYVGRSEGVRAVCRVYV